MKLDLTTAAKSNLILISGPEELLRVDTLRNLLKVCGVDDDDFDSESFMADARPVVEWVAAAGTAPFLSDRRTVVVRNLLRVDPAPSDNTAGTKKTTRANPLAGIPETGRLILVTDEDSKGDGNNNPSARIKGAWSKLVKSANGVELVCEVKAEDLIQAFTDLARDLGKKLSRPAGVLLVEMVGGSYSRGMGEIQKLALYVGEETEIREEHVKVAVTPTREWNIWALLDSVRERKVGEAVRQLRIISGSNKKMPEVAIAVVIPQLTRYFRLLWQARLCIEQGVNPNAVPDSVRIQFPSKPNWAEEKAGTTSRIIPQAKRVSFQQISACLTEISLADARLKGIEPAANAEDTMERLIMRLTEILSPVAVHA